jgi:DNA polymerase epsilon subunit 2
MASQKQLGQLFRLHGLSLRPDALKLIVETARTYAQPLELAKLIVDHVRSQKSSERVVTVAQVTSALGSVRGPSESTPSTQTVLEVIDAFETPKVVFDTSHKAYSAGPVARTMHGSAGAQREIYAGRLALVRQRLMRHPTFKRPALERLSTASSYVHITEIEALQTSEGQQCALGLLCEPLEGVFHLEDSTGIVPLDLTQAAPGNGLFTLGCIVIVEGQLSPAGIFEVATLFHPPAEAREQTRQQLDGLPAFGPTFSANSDKVRSELLEQAGDAMMIVVSDCWLDRDDVLSALEQLLDGYEASASNSDKLGADLAFVLCGNFTSEPLACSDFYAMRQHYDRLAELIRQRPTLAQHAHFVLVPGPNDLTLGAGEVLPRSGLPRVFAEGLKESVANLHLASNPVRLRFYGRDIVLFRDEHVIHTRRNAVIEPPMDRAANMSEHVSNAMHAMPARAMSARAMCA